MQDCPSSATIIPFPKLAYSKNEAAQMLSVSLRTIDNLIAQKEITVRRIGRRVIVPATSITAFLRNDHYTMLKAA
jgi:excisionase family DNA binding protein